MLRSPPLFPKESIVCCMVIREACDTAVYMHASVLACSPQCSVSMTLQLAVQADSGHDYHIPFHTPRQTVPVAKVVGFDAKVVGFDAKVVLRCLSYTDRKKIWLV